MKLVNATAHRIRFEKGGRTAIFTPAFNPAPRPARVAPERVQMTVATDDGDLEITLMVGQGRTECVPQLPAPQPGTLFIVARDTAWSHPHRHDLVWPSPLVIDAGDTRPGITCRGFASMSAPTAATDGHGKARVLPFPLLAPLRRQRRAPGSQ